MRAAVVAAVVMMIAGPAYAGDVYRDPAAEACAALHGIIDAETGEASSAFEARIHGRSVYIRAGTRTEACNFRFDRGSFYFVPETHPDRPMCSQLLVEVESAKAGGGWDSLAKRWGDLSKCQKVLQGLYDAEIKRITTVDTPLGARGAYPIRQADTLLEAPY